MALAATTVWEINAGATGGNVNGGGYNASNANATTDYSQATTAHLVITDLVIGADNTTVTSVLTPFDSLDPGNILHITAGTNFTVGWYEVLSVSGVTATLDRVCGTATSTGGTAKLGGAISLGSSTSGYTDDDVFETGVAGMKYWIKYGTYTLTAAVSITATGTNTSSIVVEGYNTTRGDVPTGTNRPTIAAGAYGFLGAGDATANWKYSNLIFTGTTNPVLGLYGFSTQFVNIKVVNSSTTANRAAITLGSGDMTCINCEAISYMGYAFNLTGLNESVLYSYAHDSVIGIRATAATIKHLIGNIVESNVTGAIVYTAAPVTRAVIIGNTLYGSENKTGTGITFITATTDVLVMNNIIYGFVTGVTHADTQTVGYDNYNDYFNNTNDVSAAGQWQKGANDQAINPGFTNVGQYTGTNASSTTNVLTDTAATFTNVVDNQDFVYISAGTGTGIGLYQYLITAHTNTTLTVSSNITSSGNGTAITYQITTGRNFAITGDI